MIDRPSKSEGLDKVVERNQTRKHRKDHESGMVREHVVERAGSVPMIVMAHSNTFESSTSPAENPSTGFLINSASHSKKKW